MFGRRKKKVDQGPEPGKAIQSLHETEEMLNKRQDFLERKVEEDLKIAKQNASKNKRVALQALKRKKRYEKQLQQIDGTISTIHFQREALESANTNTSIMKTMGYAAKALKAAHQNMNIDEVHDVMDDIAEQQAIANEISDAISNPVGMGADIDEDDLLAELDELEQEALDEKLLDTGTSVPSTLPEVPTTVPTPEGKKIMDDEEFAELAAWAN
ncbi:Charged multivesicular body protein 4b [Halocaridina rubra]|uniref:Charged multivesicular body protein 4b n=1 Tax=Halocaridina rubra TaxID=373956 RepID=A0AAN8WA59_HALRR